ncbi:MAG: Ig-like domain-containing protein [Zhaonellaceae bacterium]
MLDNAVETTIIYEEEGTYGPEEDVETIKGNVTIASDGITLRNVIINGDLLIAEEVGDGEVKLKNVTVKGEVIVKGGGPNSVELEDCNIPKITVSKDGVRIVASGNTRVSIVTLETGAILVQTTVTGSGFEEVTITEEVPANAKITLSGDFENITVEANRVNVELESGTIKELKITEEAEDTTVTVSKEAKVETMTINAPVEVKGEGTVAEANVNVTDVKFEKEPEKVNKSDEVKEQEKKDDDKKKGSGGSSGGSSTPVYISAISVEPDIMILKVNETETITVTVSPSNATDKRVTFSSSDNNIATIDENGKVTALAGGKATITVTSVADNSKKATVNVVVGDILIPATFADDPSLGTIQNEIDEADEESTIVVMPAAYPKTYNEQLVINKSLTLLGLNTALNGTITITADNVTVDGFNVVAPSDYTLPVIHIIDSDGVNIINNTVFSQGYASIGTSSGPARVTGKISGNKVTGMIIVGTDGELEVSDNDVTLTPTSTEGICFYPVETTARINVINNKIGQVRDGFTQIKVEHEPESVNGKTRDIDIIEAITEDNYGATVQLSWTTIYYVSTTGNDNNPGTQEAPFANIQKAVNAANDGDIIIVQEGSYNVWCPTTDPNNYTGRDHNLFIGKNIAIKGEGIVDIYSYQTAYKSTFDARIVVLISGSDGVVISNLNIYPAYYPGDISTGLPSVTNSKINSITGQSNLKVYYNQIVDTLMNYNGGKPTSESTITNVTVRGCTIGDPDLAAEDWGSAIYFNGYVNNTPNGISGGYTVEGNTFYGSLTLCEDAGWDSESQDCIIQNNHFYGNLHFVGERPTGWNFKSMTIFPTVIGNTFYKANASITDTDGTTYDYIIGSRDINQEKLISRSQLEDIIENNAFKGDLDGKEIDIAIGRHNYSETDDEYHAIIYVKKVTPVVATAVETTAVTEGQTLADSELSGTFKVSADDGTAVAGTLAWDAPTTIVSETGEFAWTFTPTDRLTYNVVKGFVSVEVVHPQDINVSSTNSFYVQNPDVYKGVTTEFSFSGEDLNKIISIKVELFGENDVLIGTNTLKSEKLISGGGTLPVNNGALTSPFVVIQGSYTSGSWDTVWEEGKLNPDNPPVKAVLTAVDDNGAKYIAEDNDFNSFSGNGGTWESIWYIIEANGLVYSPDGLILLDASGWNEETNTINASDFRDGVAEIGFRAFDSLNVQSVVFPESVKIIGNAAFGDNLFIESVTFPSQLEKIGTWCFEGCKNLTICFDSFDSHLYRR